MKKNLFRSLLASLVVGAGLLTSCGEEPKKPTNEIENKLHEDPARAVFTLKEGELAPAAFDGEPRLADVKYSGESQVFSMAYTKDKGWAVEESSVKALHVKSTKDNPNLVYALEIQYYSPSGQPMNHQFIDNGQDKIHQHFFVHYKTEEVDGKKRSSINRDVKTIPYSYNYADVDKQGNWIGRSNPLGFAGVLRFDQPNDEFEISCELMHAVGSKFTADGKTSPWYAPSMSQRSKDKWDMQVKLPVIVDEGKVKPHDDEEEIHRIKLIFAEGHLHGKYGFHQDAEREGSKYFKPVQIVELEHVNGKFVYTKESAQKLFAKGSSRAEGPIVYGLWIEYYDAEGQLINSEFHANGEERNHQHFFIPKDVKPSFGGKVEADDADPSKVFSYTYCDTDPWDKLIRDKAKVVGDKNPIGFKGYFVFNKWRKEFNLNIKLLHMPTGKFGDNGEVAPFYAPLPKHNAQGSWDININIPVLIFVDHYETEKFTDEDWEAIDEGGLKEEDASEALKSYAKACMTAFGATWDEIIQELYIRLNADFSPESGARWF